MGRRSELTAAQRIELMLQMSRQEETGKRQVRWTSVSTQTLYHWRDDFIRTGYGGMCGRAGQSGIFSEVKRK